MPKEGSKSGDKGGVLAPKRSEQHGNRTLGDVEQQRQRRERFAARAQHIGRADIASADLAEVAEPGELRQDEAEGNGAQEITDGKAQEIDEGLSLIHISEPTRLRRISYAVFCLKKKKSR